METVFVLCTVEPRTVKGPLIPAETVTACSSPKIDSEHPAHSLALWKKKAAWQVTKEQQVLGAAESSLLL